jgi:3-phenylpropionate/trans-cinnamate dioxygenase ferredoxin component
LDTEGTEATEATEDSGMTRSVCVVLFSTSVPSVASVDSVSNALITLAGRVKLENMAFVKVAKASGIPAGVVLGYEVEGKKVAVVSLGGKFYAFENHCSHRGAELSKGLLMGNVVVCPLHGSQFDVTTGQKIYGPAPVPIKTFLVKVEGDDVLVDL